MAAEKKTIAEAMAGVMAGVRGVGKNDEHVAPNARFKFRGIDAVMNAVGPALREHGVVVVPQLQSIEHRDVQTSGGKASRETTVLVKYLWTGPDGSTLESIVPGEAMDSGDKGTAKAMSVAFRIALLQALCLPTDDPDPDSQQFERSVPIGRGDAPRNGHRPMTATAEDTVGDARAALAKKCTEMGYDLDKVAGKFREKYGQELGEATDATRVRGFTKLLDGIPELDLKATA